MTPPHLSQELPLLRTEWDQHVSSWFEGHEGQVQAILDAASGITEEAVE